MPSSPTSLLVEKPSRRLPREAVELSKRKPLINTAQTLSVPIAGRKSDSIEMLRSTLAKSVDLVLDKCIGLSHLTCFPLTAFHC